MKQREKSDQFFWYVNDLIKKARPGYAGPSTYEEWLGDNPNRTIQAWFNEEVERYIERKQLAADWRDYYRNPGEDTLNRACQHCYENILKDTLVVIEGKQAAAFADAIREVLPKQLPVEYKRSAFPKWISYEVTAGILNVREDYLRKLARPGKIIRHPQRRLIYRDSVFDYRDGIKKPTN